ncbi:MAG: PHP domain-containing protein [Nitrospirota bacterium]|nr:PHP domain-containing protein [Nitrospirota bacterium]
MSRGGWKAIALCGLWLAMAVVQARADEPALTPLVTSFHVHSTVSTGDLTLDQVAEQAEALGLDAVVLTDNFVLRYEYGLYPFRGLLKRTFSIRSVLDYGLDRFLNDVAAAQARHPKVLLVPGVEVVPHYYWTGSLFEGNLTMHNSQKNILVFGLPRAEDYAALPVNGNPGSYRYDWASVVTLSPVLLFVPATWLWFRRTARVSRDGRVSSRARGTHRLASVTLAAAASLLLFNAWPVGTPVYSSYDEHLSYRPYQTFIDAVAARGGATIWSMPEARDFNQFDYGPLGKVTVKTDPYPEALVMTSGYTGFGGIYQDNRTVTDPGNFWDQLLGQYAARRKGPAPPFTVGEIAFHGMNRDTRELDQVLTIFWVRQRNAAGLLEALRSGRLYSVGQYTKGSGLRLEQFRVECEGGARGAVSGESLDPNGAGDVTVRVKVTAVDQGAQPITLTVIRSGQVAATLTGVTPFEQVLTDPGAPPGVWNYYRLSVKGQGSELLSNPIFVGPVQAAQTDPPGAPLASDPAVAPAPPAGSQGL